MNEEGEGAGMGKLYTFHRLVVMYRQQLCMSCVAHYLLQCQVVACSWCMLSSCRMAD